MNWLKTKWTDFIYWIQATLGCSINPWTGKNGLCYKIYCTLAGSLECMCCIFWRGLFIGLALGVIVGFIVGILV